MYIATGYFGTGNQIIATGGTETLWISGSIRYKSHEFKGTTGTFQVLSGKTSAAEVLVVGGGGLRGTNSSVGTDDFWGGGGGGGGFIYSSSISFTSGDSYTISAGGGRANFSGSTGNPSQMSGSNLYISASGGGGGANGNITNGKNGGSGGGGGSSPGSGISGQGNQGGFRAVYFTGASNEYWGGGGGGAGANGGNATSTFRGGGKGGVGKINRILNGTTLWYSGGGGGAVGATAIDGGSGSYGYPQFTLTGQSNTDLTAGGGGPSIGTLSNTTPGTIIIKYPYQPVNVNNCDCYEFSVTGSSPTVALISYVQAGTGNFVEAESLPQNTIVYRSVVSGSQSQIWNWNNNSGNTTNYSKAYSGFCTSSI